MPKIYVAPYYTEEQIEEMEERDMKFPYSDKYMVYDGLKRQYIPTESLLLKYGINLDEFLRSSGSDSPASLELEYVSDQIYSYIDKSSGSTIDILKYIIAKSFRRGMSKYRFRLLFEEILAKQAKYYVDNDDLTKSSGVDIESKQYLGKGVLLNEDRHIDPKVKTLLMDLGLSWAGSYDEWIFMRGFETDKEW